MDLPIKVYAGLMAASILISTWKLTKQGRNAMEDKVLYSGEFGGPHGKIVVEIKDKNVQASIVYGSDELEGDVTLKIKSKAGLELLKGLIPGKIDDAIISVIEMALGV